MKRYLLLLALLGSMATHAEFVPETPTTATLPAYDGQDWFWIHGFRAPNQVDSRGFLFNGEGRQLGQISQGFWANTILNARQRDEIISLETYFSRGTRGERTDVVVVYDPRTLSPTREIVIPPKRQNAVKNSGVARLTEDERFLLVVNYTPAQSITVVDLERNRVVEEVETPGCSVIYTAGNRDFYAICGNGGFMQLKLDDSGQVIRQRRTEPLFDPVQDFLTISASRIDDTWYFVSRLNNIYAIRMAGDAIEVTNVWPLTTPEEREDEWLISGLEHTASHAESQRLYVLMHQGTPDTFEGPGTHVWVYDARTGKKVQSIEMQELTLSIAVSDTGNPRLYALDIHFPVGMGTILWLMFTEGEEALAEIARQRANIYDAMSGEHIRASELIPPGTVTGIRPW